MTHNRAAALQLHLDDPCSDSITHEPAPAWPADWPGDGPIDLDRHDRPHASSALEWWYVNAQLEIAGRRRVGIFAAFFRQATGRTVKGQIEYAHSIAWALSDPQSRRYLPVCAIDQAAVAFGLRKIDSGAAIADERVARALREVLLRGHAPLPTRMLEGEPRVAADRLDLAFGANRLSKRPSGEYELHLRDEKSGTACDLVLAPQKAAVRHGNDGVIHGVSDELMFYYFIPRNRVTGELVMEGARCPVVSGLGWYDHEFGYVPEAGAPAPRPEPSRALPAKRAEGGATSWSWAGIQLDDGADVTVYTITRAGTGDVLDHWAVVSDGSGRRAQYDRVMLRPLQTWRSPRSFLEYPTRWRLVVPEAKLDLTLEATFDDQELVTVISDPAFWEGQVTATGTRQGGVVTGLGWAERKGLRFERLDEFFASASALVRKRVEDVMPLQPSETQLQDLMVRTNGARCLDGLDAGQLSEALIRPVREIIDRGGKAWRSYAALACIDVVGGDSRKFLHWLPIPELLHVGSLVVDDVEDRSTVRRGGPTAHVMFGEALAINAGTAAYFIAEPPVARDDLPPETKVRIYQLYFDGMRAGHAGQALDLAGVGHAIGRAVDTGDVTALEARVLCIHRLKTAVPAGTLARIGALLGGGTEAQVDAVGRFFEAAGLAFQIIDDVLNLRGFRGDLKTKGEDIAQGKITLPVVKALGKLPNGERQTVAALIAGKPQAPETIGRIIARLELVGALDACVAQAHDLVESAWRELDPLIEDSQYKITFRAFGWYVLERHY